MMFFKTYCGESNAETPIVKTTYKGSEKQRMGDLFLKKLFRRRNKKSRNRRTKKTMNLLHCKANFQKKNFFSLKY